MTIAGTDELNSNGANNLGARRVAWQLTTPTLSADLRCQREGMNRQTEPPRRHFHLRTLTGNYLINNMLNDDDSIMGVPRVHVSSRHVSLLDLLCHTYIVSRNEINTLPIPILKLLLLLLPLLVALAVARAYQNA